MLLMPTNSVGVGNYKRHSLERIPLMNAILLLVYDDKWHTIV